MSIILLIRSLETGGAQRQLVHLAIGLKHRGHAVQVAVFYNRGPLIADLRASGVPIIDLGKKGRWDMLGFISAARAAMRRIDADVLYSFVGEANVIAALLGLVLPRIKVVWSVRASDMDLTRYDWGARASYRLERALSRVPKLIIANSRAGRSHAISHGFPADRIEVVPNGIDTDRFRPSSRLRKHQRDRWGLADDEIAIGMLARLDPMKGHENFLRAAAIASTRLGKARFICVGDGSEETRIHGVAHQLGIADRVLFVGRTDDPISALNAFDVYCSASNYGEGFSNSVAEAMACGLACIVTDVGDSAELVGSCGTVVPRADPDALAAAIVAQAQRLQQHDPMLPRRRIIENFSLDQMLSRTVQLIATTGAPSLSSAT